MKKRFQILIVLLFTFSYANAQPGGGGGLSIRQLYDKDLNKIYLNDSSLVVRTFVMGHNNTEAKIYAETFQRKMNYPVGSIYLPPNKKYRYNNFFPANSINPTQRIYINYKKTTMIIDINGIWGENGSGGIDHMDSLVIQKGYFQYNRSRNSINKINEPRVSSFGITPYTIDVLNKYDFFKSSNKVDISFLKEKNILPTYYLSRGAYYFRTDLYKLAITELYLGIEKGLKGKRKESAFVLLYRVYVKTEEYEKAVEAITQAIKIKKSGYNYQHRLKIYIKLKQYNKALNDYNDFVRLAETPKYAINERALFKIKYLKDYTGAVKDMEEAISKETDFNHNRFYAKNHYILGLGQYCLGEDSMAYKNWFLAIEYNYSSCDDYLIHFDSIIVEHPKEPKLYIMRAYSHYFTALSNGSRDYRIKYCHLTIKDLDKAEELGSTDYRMYLLRARTLVILKKYDEALIQINLSILKNNQNSQSFSLRYQIRRDLGQADYDYKLDVDIIEANRLYKLGKLED